MAVNEKKFVNKHRETFEKGGLVIVRFRLKIGSRKVDRQYEKYTRRVTYLNKPMNDHVRK